MFTIKCKCGDFQDGFKTADEAKEVAESNLDTMLKLDPSIDMSKHTYETMECCDRCSEPFNTSSPLMYLRRRGVQGWTTTAAPSWEQEYCMVGEEKICYVCAARDTQAYMREHGKIILYLTKNADKKDVVGNWTGHLTYYPLSVSCKPRGHFIPNVGYVPRYDVWFVANNYVWHGVNYGDMTQLLHCKQTKKKWCKYP